MQTKLLINGALVGGEGTVERVLDPATGKCIAEVPEASRAQSDAAVAAAEEAGAGLGANRTQGSGRLLLRLADRIEADAAAFAKLESDNTGKPLAAALNDEMPAIADVFRFFAGAARTQHGALAGEYLPGFTSMVRRDPVGVDRLDRALELSIDDGRVEIGPGSCGRQHGGSQALGADAADRLEAAPAAGGIVPQGRRQHHLRPRRKCRCAAGRRIPRVRMVSLTGDVATGQKILSAAAANLKRTHLELGGKAPVIVFDDADLEAVVAGVRTFGFYNAGQDCTAACRVYAGAKIYDRLVADLGAAVRSLKVGMQTEAGVEMGPLISAEQRARVAGFVERAAANRHMEVTTGGKVRAGARLLLRADARRRRTSNATRSCSAKYSDRWFR